MQSDDLDDLLDVCRALAAGDGATEFRHAHNVFNAAVTERATMLESHALEGREAATLRRRGGRSELAVAARQQPLLLVDAALNKQADHLVTRRRALG